MECKNPARKATLGGARVMSHNARVKAMRAWHYTAIGANELAPPHVLPHSGDRSVSRRHCRKCGVVRHSKFGRQCLSWVISDRSSRILNECQEARQIVF